MKVVPPGDQISWFQTQQHWSIVPLAMFLFMSQGFPLVHRTRSEERQAKGSYSVQFSNVSPKVYTRGQKFVTSLAPDLESRFCRSFCLLEKGFLPRRGVRRGRGVCHRPPSSLPSAICRAAAAATAGERGEDHRLSESGSDLVVRRRQHTAPD